ncbi:MAG: hypothetical protein CMO81_05010 [Waddliaceae bacterium]|nr:hypothetical protein [Waddliaceae bacterium]
MLDHITPAKDSLEPVWRIYGRNNEGLDESIRELSLKVFEKLKDKLEEKGHKFFARLEEEGAGSSFGLWEIYVKASSVADVTGLMVDFKVPSFFHPVPTLKNAQFSVLSEGNSSYYVGGGVVFGASVEIDGNKPDWQNQVNPIDWEFAQKLSLN